MFKLSKNKIIYLSAVVFLILIVVSVLFLNNNQNNVDNESLSDINTESYTENPIDFDYFKNKNPEIYAWIYVPNTNISYPIAQSKTNDNFYLHHNIFGNYEYAGTVYSEKKYNSTDFSDSNTILYGHNMTKGYMFENLNKFQDKEFFDNNLYFYIYTPEKILTYMIISAFQHNDTHIMYDYNLNKTDGFERYLSLVKKPLYSIKYVRENIDLSADDKLVTLSTCLGSGKYYRYLVVGVLTDTKNTK